MWACCCPAQAPLHLSYTQVQVWVVAGRPVGRAATSQMGGLSGHHAAAAGALVSAASRQRIQTQDDTHMYCIGTFL